VLGVAVAAVGAWVQHQQQSRPQDEPRAAQEAAHRLLVQLRVVSRRLPGTLSPAATAENLLIGLRDVMRVERGAVMVSSGGQRLVPLAYVGGGTLDWQLDLSDDSVIAEAWASQLPASRDRQHARAHGATPTGSCLAVPLTLGRRSFGVVALESSARGVYDVQAVATAVERADAVALSLDTGLLFDEIRSVATAEERQRVAREIHDGIAQELVYLGYALDDAIADVEGRRVQQSLLDVRAEVGRVVGELRMSLFDLRSAVDPQAGLGTALGEHVRSVGTRSGLTVHLSLAESNLRLPPETEAELLRIAQEAIANARKHADAGNLWVSYEVDPPFAVLVVEDDGKGLSQQPGGDSYGLTIMRERAQRIRGGLDVGPRPGGGTRVCVRLDGVAARRVTTGDETSVRPL
jgi:signal transduction histidine kinase